MDRVYFRRCFSILFSIGIILIALFLLVDFLRLETKSQSPLIQDPVISEMISKISETEIYNTVYRLQNFTTRSYGYSGNVAAAAWLFNRFSSISGLSVEYQSSYQNIIATLPAENDIASNAIYIVGAHYDSTSSNKSYAPGATDNGGGVAIVLEFARIMSQYKFNHTLKFALWNAEEDGVLGSAEYVRYAVANNLHISLYMNFDSACYDPNNQKILDIMYNDQSKWVSDIMTEYNTLYGINFTLMYNSHTCSSDYRPFWWHEYTAVMTHAETHGPAHSDYDTLDQVSTLYAKKNGQLGMSVLAKLAEVQDNKPPSISILSPENKTYPTHNIRLVFTIDETVEWIGCSVDKQTNQSITGNTTLHVLSDGWHQLTLHANDTFGNMGMSAVYFAVDTTPPVADAGDHQTVNEDTLFTFEGSASTDENGIATYTWVFTDSTPQTLSGKNPTYMFAAPGAYTVTLEVADPAGNTATDTVTITVLDVTDPVANAGQDQTVNVEANVSFDASGSTDNVDVVSYVWDFGDGTTGAGKTTTYTYTSSGTYAVTLTVKDAANNSATDTLTVKVLPAQPPLAEVSLVWVFGAIAIIAVATAATLLWKRPK